MNFKNLQYLLDDQDKKRFSWLVCQMIITALLEFAGIALVLPFIKLAGNQISVENLPNFLSGFMNFNSQKSILIWLGIVIFILIVTASIFKIFLSFKEQKFIWEISHKLGIRQHKKILTKPYKFFIEKNSSEIITNLIVETSFTVKGVLLPCAQLISKSVLAILFLLFITYLHPKVSLLLTSISIFVCLILFLTMKSKLIELGQKRVSLERLRFIHLKESIYGIKTVKSHQKDSFFLNKFSKISQQYSFIQPFVNTLNVVPKNILDIILFGGVIIIVSLFILSGRNISVLLPSLTFYVFVGIKLLPTIQSIMVSIFSIKYQLPSLRLVVDGLKDVDSSHSVNVNNKSLNFLNNIVLENCCFSHKNDKVILNNISIKINKGQRIGIVGYSGSGKTTLVEILSGLLVFDSGNFMVDETKIDPGSRSELMKLIAIVPQDIFLFDDSVLNNIVFEDQDDQVDYDKLKSILELLSLESLIQNLPLGLETNVGERGIKLSGGQKQRIGLARALYKSPEILILDESTNALDYLTEMELLSNLQTKLPMLTIIKVAHRLKSVKNCDKIYLLDNGSIIAEGRFEEVIQNNNLFKEMVEAGTI